MLALPTAAAHANTRIEDKYFTHMTTVDHRGFVLLPLPVLMTTAGGQETQAFALLHMLAAGFVVRVWLDRRRAGQARRP